MIDFKTNKVSVSFYISYHNINQPCIHLFIYDKSTFIILKSWIITICALSIQMTELAVLLIWYWYTYCTHTCSQYYADYCNI